MKCICVVRRATLHWIRVLAGRYPKISVPETCVTGVLSHKKVSKLGFKWHLRVSICRFSDSENRAF